MIKISFLITATYGVESVVITNNAGGRVCLECLFSSFSADSGCTVELMSSGSVQYTETLNRNGSHAEGCIQDISTGLYNMHVYDAGSNAVAQIVSAVSVNNPVFCNIEVCSTLTENVFEIGKLSVLLQSVTT